ncbi:MAG: preprotein translocase subunit SecA, partial [Verrucomicrobia bacterium]
MIQWFLKKVIGSKNTRMLNALRPTVDRINQFEVEFQRLSDDELRAKVKTWKSQLSAESEPAAQQRILNELLPEAFAAVKNAARRLTERKHTFIACDQEARWEMVHFDVQLIGGICLHRGTIVEMATGEGKTLVATLPLFLNGLSGRGAHLVTTNDYLARRDAEWMSQIYGFLG